MTLVLDLVPAQELTGFVRGVQIEEERNRFLLSAYLPNDFIDEIEWRTTLGTLTDTDAATIRAWDTEAPIGKRQGLRRIWGELPPISRKIRLGEEERLRKRKLETGNVASLVNALYDDAAHMARSVLARIEMMRGEALETGMININENGVSQVVDFSRAAGHTVTAATKWDAGGDVVADLRSWTQTYIDTNGVAPAFALTSTKVITTMMTNNSLRQLATAVSGTPGLITLATVQTILQAFGLPPVVPYDTNVRIAGVQTRVTNQKKLTLMPPDGEPLGATLFGTTAESLELIEARALQQSDAPGMVATIHKLDDPVSTWTKAACIAMPVLPNPNLTLTALVLT